MEVLGKESENAVKLYDLVQRLPKGLLADQFYKLVGERTSFSPEEAEEIVTQANILFKEALPVEPDDPLDALVESIFPSKPQVVERREILYVRNPDAHCRGLLEKTACNAPIVDKGVEGTGFCERCWYPSVVEDYDQYKSHREEGYGRTEAAQMAGIQAPPERRKRIATYAERKPGKRTDDVHKD